MSTFRINVLWSHEGLDFTYETYDRTHLVRFSGGQTLETSSAPEFLGNKNLTNPEEMLAAALSSCHMLTFLAVAAKSRVVVEQYEDDVTAEIAKNEEGRFFVSKVTLSPWVTLRQDQQEVTQDRLRQLHDKAHKNCIVANSLKCAVEINLRF